MTDDLIFSENALILSSHIALSKFTGAQKIREFERDTLVFLSDQENEDLSCTKCLYEMKN